MNVWKFQYYIMSTRREFVKHTIFTASALCMSPSFERTSPLEISLAEWSLNRGLKAGKIDHLDFPSIASKQFGINVVEYVNGCFGSYKRDFKEAGKDLIYLRELLKRSKDAGVTNHLIMVDEEGFLAKPDDKERLAAVENHKKWIDAAKFLECRTVRVNLHGPGDTSAKKTASI